MVWFVKPLKKIDTDIWHLCAKSDEGGGFYAGCDHEHKTPEEATNCAEARREISLVTGFPDEPPKKGAAMTRSPTPWKLDTDLHSNAILDANDACVLFDELTPDAIIQPIYGRIIRAVNAHDDLVAALANFEIKGPDADGLLWLVINGWTKKAMFNLGRATGIAAEVAVLFEQTRKAALEKAGV